MAGTGVVSIFTGMENSEAGFADQHRDGVLVDGAVGGDAGPGLFRILERDLRFGHVLVAVDAGFVRARG